MPITHTLNIFLLLFMMNLEAGKVVRQCHIIQPSLYTLFRVRRAQVTKRHPLPLPKREGRKRLLEVACGRKPPPNLHVPPSIMEWGRGDAKCDIVEVGTIPIKGEISP
jgi:hypothetical protein